MINENENNWKIFLIRNPFIKTIFGIVRRVRAANLTISAQVNVVGKCQNTKHYFKRNRMNEASGVAPA